MEMRSFFTGQSELTMTVHVPDGKGGLISRKVSSMDELVRAKQEAEEAVRNAS
jgi:hypothetical protein